MRRKTKRNRLPKRQHPKKARAFFSEFFLKQPPLLLLINSRNRVAVEEAVQLDEAEAIFDDIRCPMRQVFSTLLSRGLLGPGVMVPELAPFDGRDTTGKDFIAQAQACCRRIPDESRSPFLYKFQGPADHGVARVSKAIFPTREADDAGGY